MDIRQMYYFAAVAAEGNMTKAAEKMYISQSTLSLSIKKLETELGTSLFYKQGRNIALTAAGALVYEKVSDILQQIYVLKDQIAELESKDVTKVSVVMEAVDFALEGIMLLNELHPEVEITHFRANHNDLYRHLQMGEADIGVSLFPCEDASFASQAVLTEPMMLLANQKHPLGKSAEKISLSELKNEVFLSTPSGDGLHLLQQTIFSQAGIQPGKIITVNDPESLAMSVQSNLGLGLIPRSVVNQQNWLARFPLFMCKARPVIEPYCSRTVYLIYRKTNAAKYHSVLSFLEQFGEFAANNEHFPCAAELTGEHIG